MYTLGVDIGGTFTDFTVYNRRTGEVHVEKCLTTPEAPEQAVLAGLELLASRLPNFAATTERISHATTLVTNAIRHLGKNAIDEPSAKALKQRFTASDCQRLLKDARYVEGWIYDEIRRIVSAGDK